MDECERITQVTEQLNDRVEYLCKEYDIPTATMVGIVESIKYNLLGVGSD